jgi:hypothetical protein
VFVEVPQVIGRYDTEAPQERGGQADVGRDVLRVRREQLRQHVLTAYVHAVFPGQVVEAGGLLPHATAGQRQRLVHVTGRLPADAQL